MWSSVRWVKPRAIFRRLAARYPDVTFVLGSAAAQEATLADPQPNVFRFAADGTTSVAGLGAYAYHDLGWRRAALVMDRLGRGVVQRRRLHRRVLLAGRDDRAAADGPCSGAPDGRRRTARSPAGSGQVDGVALLLSPFSDSPRAPARLATATVPLPRAPGARPRLRPSDSPSADVSRRTRTERSGGGDDVPPDSERPPWRRIERAFAAAFPRHSRASSATGPVELPVYMRAEAVARRARARSMETSVHAAAGCGRRCRKVAFDGPAGPVRLDRNRQGVVSVHLRRIEGGGSGPARCPSGWSERSIRASPGRSRPRRRHRRSSRPSASAVACPPGPPAERRLDPRAASR